MTVSTKSLKEGPSGSELFIVSKALRKSHFKIHQLNFAGGFGAFGM